jgi:CDP-glycerol glycerophosphotransferase (TagB/SpsB family)
MKIDKRDPRHWLALVRLGLATLAAIVLRPLRRRAGRPLVLFYGHKLNGNLLALYRYLRETPAAGLEPRFLGIDAGHVAELRQAGEPAVLGTRLAGVGALADCAAIVTSHGLHSMQPLLRFSDIRFVDVWHGIPYKGFDAEDFRVQQRYDEVWVASPLHRALYLERYGFDPGIVHATGYARTDRLVSKAEDPAALRRAYGLPAQCKLVLFAPTWAQDAQGRSLYPFGQSEADFLEALSGVAAHCGATIMMRAHQNSGTQAGAGYPNVLAVPAGRFPDTEGLLLVSDVLVCDWSSIAFDYLVLDRPTLFLDVPSPFRKGFSLGPEYRFGPVLGSLDALLEQLRVALLRPDDYHAAHGGAHRRVREEVYGGLCDGRASARGAARLAALLAR